MQQTQMLSTLHVITLIKTFALLPNPGFAATNSGIDHAMHAVCEMHVCNRAEQGT